MAMNTHTNVSTPGGSTYNVSGMASVDVDTTPQLGGNLDVNGNSIVSVSNGDITIAPDGTGVAIVVGDTYLSDGASGTEMRVYLDDGVSVPANESYVSITGNEITNAGAGAGALDINGVTRIDLNTGGSTRGQLFLSSMQWGVDVKPTSGASGSITLGTSTALWHSGFFSTEVETPKVSTASGDLTLEPNSDRVVLDGDRLNINTTHTPGSAGATGTAGDIVYDADYIYVCVATDTWKRVAILTWP
jgi:hypothetical protein